MARIDGIGRLARRIGTLGLSLTLACACFTVAADAGAAPARQKAKAQPTRAEPRKAPAKPASTPRARAKPAPRPAPAAPAVPAESPRELPATAEAPVASPEGTSRATQVVKTEADRAGEKTYTFGAQEVEGRLKSPQILYFLRRVRAEFAPAPLGHRSFLLELADTRRHPALE